MDTRIGRIEKIADNVVLADHWEELTNKEKEHLEQLPENERYSELKKLRQIKAEQADKQALMDRVEFEPTPKHDPDNHKKRDITTKAKRKMIKKSRKKNRRK